MPYMIFALAFVVILMLLLMKRSGPVQVDRNPDYKLKITSGGMPYYLPQDGKSDILVPYEHFLKAFPEEFGQPKEPKPKE